MKLFIAEKPSLAQAIAAGIGVGKKSDGYISLNGGKEIVTWCYGHILAQLNPDEYAEKYRLWRMEDLPIIPSLWKLKVKPDAAKQFRIVRELISKATTIVNAGDPDREGQLLVDEVLDYVGNKKPVQRIDALTSTLTVQTWIAETKLKTKLSLFLPTFYDSVLTDIEQNPDKLFTSMNNARSILKKLYHEETVLIEEPITSDDAFRDLKIIYHGSEVELKSIDGRNYRNESVITSSEAYKFLFALKTKSAKESFKTWLEFSFKDYSHGKFLLSDKIPKDEPISAFLRTRLNKNRQHLLHNPQDLKQYIPTGKTIRADDLLQQVKLESTLFLSVMDDFEQEENSYLSNHPELLQIS